jgi:hypothetical protein
MTWEYAGLINMYPSHCISLEGKIETQPHKTRKQHTRTEMITTTMLKCDINKSNIS